MNTLIIGTELPNYSHPVLQPGTSLDQSDLSLDAEERLIAAVQNLPVFNYIETREKLNLYYMEKFRAIRKLYAVHLEEFAVIGSQYPVHAAVLKFNYPISISPLIPYVKEMNLYNEEVNRRFDQYQDADGIRIGIGDADLMIYESLFEKLNFCFISQHNILTNQPTE